MTKHGAGHSRERKEATKRWVKWFEKRYDKQPGDVEGRAFGQGFDMGWKSKFRKDSGKIPISSIDGKQPIPQEAVEGLINSLEDVKKGRYEVITNKPSSKAKNPSEVKQ